MTTINHYQSTTEKENNSIPGLFINELKRAYSVEKLHINILEKLTAAASNDELGEILDEHMDITEVQLNRIEEIFRLLNIETVSETHETMEMLCKEAEKTIEEIHEPQLRDPAILNIVQKMEDFEITSYRTLISYSEKIGNADINELLQATLDEEEDAEKVFNKLAESTLVNA